MKWKEVAINPKPSYCWRTAKISYDKKGAISASKRPAIKRALNTKSVRAYHCPFCNHWHLTKQQKND